MLTIQSSVSKREAVISHSSEFNQSCFLCDQSRNRILHMSTHPIRLGGYSALFGTWVIEFGNSDNSWALRKPPSARLRVHRQLPQRLRQQWAEVPMSPINVIIVKFHAGDKCRNKQTSNLSFVNKGNLFQPRLSKKFTTNCIWRWQTSGNRVVGARFKDDSKAGSADALRLPTDDTTWVCRK